MSELRYAYGYIRVSTHDQEEISPDSQENLLREYAARNNIVILKIFSDLGISGRKAEKRPGFQEMVGLAKGSDHPVDLNPGMEVLTICPEPRRIHCLQVSSQEATQCRSREHLRTSFR
ncbi:MAG: recombinase family protein [Dorea formicigenerans]